MEGRDQKNGKKHFSFLGRSMAITFHFFQKLKNSKNHQGPQMRFRGDSSVSESATGCFSKNVSCFIEKKSFVDFLLTFEKIDFLKISIISKGYFWAKKVIFWWKKVDFCYSSHRGWNSKMQFFHPKNRSFQTSSNFQDMTPSVSGAA